MLTSVIVSVLNPPALTENFLKRLSDLRLEEEFEVILVNDGDQNIGTQRAIAEYQKALNSRIIINEISAGYGIANNMGAEAANGDVLVFMNTDVFPDRGAITSLARTLRQQAHVGVTQGLLLYPQTGKVQSSGHIFGPFFNRHALMGRSSSAEIVQRPAERQALTAAFYAIRAEDFRAMRGFDTTYLNSHEGMELALRINLEGKKCYYDPTCLGYHVQGGSRRHLQVDESQQFALFWSRWHENIQIDLNQLLAAQLSTTDRDKPYLIINLSTNLMWHLTLEALGIQGETVAAPLSRGHPTILEDTLAPSIRDARREILFLVDHFSHVENNKMWFLDRPVQGDLILDCHGNVIRPKGLD